MTLYVPSLFRIDDPAKLVDFIARNAFGTLISSGEDGLQVSHIPFLPEMGADGKLRLLGHVARANGQWRELESAREVMAIFQGPHGYISPTWYENHPAVPTWNYAVVHAHAKVRALDETGLRRLIRRLSATYEAGRQNPWRIEDQPAGFVDGLVKAIVGFELEVERLEGKFKLSQNRPGNDALRVVEALEREGETALAALMREHPRKA